MPLIEDAKRVADAYLRVSDEEAIPAGRPVLVPAARLDEALAVPGLGRLGLAWPNNRDVGELAPHLHRLSLIALAFPSFRDGRAYTQARILKERLGYAGTLRATGQVLRDQVFFMARAGFTSFELVKEEDAAAFEETLRRYDLVYQPAADRHATVRDLRRALA